MNKLKLDLDELKVESFDTDGSSRAVGTVHAHAPPTYWCDSADCQTDWSCEGGASMCYQICSATHGGSCSCPQNSCSCPENSCSCPQNSCTCP
jgi:hypothetical protein